MFSIITGVIGLASACLIIWLVRKDRLHVNHAIGWIFAALAFALLGFAPGIVDLIAARVGVAYPPVLGLTLAIAVLVLKTLLMDIEHSRLEARSERIAQRLAILEAYLDQMNETKALDRSLEHEEVLCSHKN